jgi:hypothetical protein
MAYYKYPPLQLPADGTIVWVRAMDNEGQPFLAAWNNTTQQFTSSVNSMVYPVYMITKWRYQ